jgi:hypothetical protein
MSPTPSAGYAGTPLAKKPGIKESSVVALPIGFVDIEVRAVDEVWSGLRLVVRKVFR